MHESILSATIVESLDVLAADVAGATGSALIDFGRTIGASVISGAHSACTARRAGCAPAAIAPVLDFAPLPKVAKNKSAVAMLFETARILQHECELSMLEFTPLFEVFEVEAAEFPVFWTKNSNAGSLRRVNPVDVPASLKNRNRGEKALIHTRRDLLPRVANDDRFPGAEEFCINLLQELGGGMAGIDEQFRNPFVGVVEKQQPMSGIAVAPGAADLLVVGLERIRDIGVDNKSNVRAVDAHSKG